MRVLILGAGGMLGHKLMQRLAVDFTVAGTIRGTGPDATLASALPDSRFLGGVLADQPDTVARALDVFRPDTVVNCIGIIKQLREAQDPVPSITVNALFPHQLTRLCAARGARLIHFSTDCVFSGDRGPYREDSPADAGDLYGRTKLLGEVVGPGCLTLRSSIIGHELSGHVSLVDWFLSRRGGHAQGYANALYTGLTTPAMAGLVARILAQWPDLEGLWQVASEPISKYDLLGILNRVYELGITLARDEAFRCDRRLDGSRFRTRTGYSPPSWETMVKEMHDDHRSAERENARPAENHPQGRDEI